MESPRTSHGGDSNAAASPEFEFWMVRNPSFPQPHQLTADQLFVDGVLLPLRHLSLHQPPDPPPPPPPQPNPTPAAISAAPSTGSKRWKDLFRVGGGGGDKKQQPDDKEKKKERKGINAGGAEININIWPFSRSRSAGGGAGGGGAAARAKAAAMRKSSSAPCSRSNSRGERRWAASPGRAAGVHVGRSSPVWQVRRPAPAKAGRKGIGGGVRVLNLNVNTCIGYRSPVGCRGDDKDGVTAGERSGEGGAGNGVMFSLRGLFSKKVY